MVVSGVGYSMFCFPSLISITLLDIPFREVEGIPMFLLGSVSGLENSFVLIKFYVFTHTDTRDKSKHNVSAQTSVFLEPVFGGWRFSYLHFWR